MVSKQTTTLMLRNNLDRISDLPPHSTAQIYFHIYREGFLSLHLRVILDVVARNDIVKCKPIDSALTVLKLMLQFMCPPVVIVTWIKRKDRNATNSYCIICSLKSSFLKRDKVRNGDRNRTNPPSS